MEEALRPYRGLRVLDASQGIAGPYCAMLLAACGADVIKLEPPEGDWSRGLGTVREGMSLLTVAVNRGKRSVVLDLKSVPGREAATRLAARADVVIEAFRPGVAPRLGLGPENAKADAVYLSISGFGQQGPYGHRPATDSVIQAFSGLVALNAGEDGIPHRVGTYVCDFTTAMCAFAAVQVALAARARDAIPQRRVIDLSLMTATTVLLTHHIAEWGYHGAPIGAINLPAGSYRARDGTWIMIALVRETDWPRLCDVLALPQLKEDPRFATFTLRAANREALLPPIRAAFACRDGGEWLQRLHAAALHRLETKTAHQHPVSFAVARQALL